MSSTTKKRETETSQPATAFVPPEKRKVELVPTEDTFNVYSNFCDVNWSRHDLTVRFGQITPKLKDHNTWIADEEVRVTLAWAYAKTLNHILTRLIQNYEKANGEIKQPALAVAPDATAVADIAKEIGKPM